MVKLTKPTGEILLISPNQVVEIEREGTVTVVRTRVGGTHLVLELPDEIAARIEEARMEEKGAGA